MIQYSNLPPEAVQQLTRLEVLADTMGQSASFCVNRVSEISKILGVNPDAPNNNALRIEQTELNAQRAERQEKWKIAVNLLARVRTHLQQEGAKHPDREFELVEVKPKLGKGETAVAALERVRNSIQELKKTQRQLQIAPVTKAEMKVAAGDYVGRLFEVMQPKIRMDGPNMRVDVTGFDAIGGAVGGLTPRHILALMAMVVPNELLHALERQIEQMPEHPNALPFDGREKKLEQIAVDLDGLERQEEAIIQFAWSSGNASVERRPDCDVMALLGIRPKPRTQRVRSVKPLRTDHPLGIVREYNPSI